MNRIVHIALKVDDLERSRQFYEKIFGFRENKTEKVRDHTSCHLSDGVIDLSIMQYDAGTQSAESTAAGQGPCIHHFAVEVGNMAAAERQIREFGCEIISDPGVVPVKFRAPGGTVCEIVPKLRYKKVKAKARPKKQAKTKAKAKKRAKRK
jgi:lactoylglutathione lyase